APGDGSCMLLLLPSGRRQRTGPTPPRDLSLTPPHPSGSCPSAPSPAAGLLPWVAHKKAPPPCGRGVQGCVGPDLPRTLQDTGPHREAAASGLLQLARLLAASALVVLEHEGHPVALVQRA